MSMPTTAQAQLVSTGHPCNYLVSGVSVLSMFEPDASACLGAFSGNVSPQMSDILAAISAAGWGTATVVGKTDAGSESGPFQNFANVGTGTIKLDAGTSLTGDYILALKAANSFSLYQFLNLNGVTQFNYTTIGVTAGGGASGQGLSNVTLLSTRTVTVPEPASMALLLTGLAGIGIAARRRRDDLV